MTPLPLSDAITSVDLTTWGPNVRCHDKGGRSMGSTDIAAVVPTRGGVARASRIWRDGGCDRIFDVLAPSLSTTDGGESIRQVGKLLETPAETLDGEARLLEVQFHVSADRAHLERVENGDPLFSIEPVVCACEHPLRRGPCLDATSCARCFLQVSPRTADGTLLKS